MKLAFTAVVLFLVTCCSPSRQEDQLVPKYGLRESKHGVSKRDLSETDIELILKALMSKMDHSAMESGAEDKKIGMDHGHYLHEPGMVDESHLSGVKGDAFKHETFPQEEAGYEIKKGLGTSEKDIMALMMKIKELDATKSLEDSYKKGTIPEEKYYTSEEVYSSKNPIMKGEGKMLEPSTMDDRFGDKEVSLAESLYHMKIAGDVEIYPNIKMQAFKDKMSFDKDPSILKATADEAYLKKVDEIGKSILEEESYKHLKDDDIEGYLKKVTEESKAPFHDPKLVHSDTAFKSAEEKAIESWKAGHKDVFATEGGIFLDEKLKTVEPHLAEGHIAHGISDEMIKKLKATIGMGKELGKEDELLLFLSKELHKEAGMEEGSHAYEKTLEQVHKDAHIGLSEEEMKKYIEEALSLAGKEKFHGTEVLSKKGLAEETLHGVNTKTGSGIEKSLHEMLGEEAFKSKAHAFDESFGFEMDKTKFGGKIPLEGEIKHVVTHEIPLKHGVEADKDFKMYEEALKKEKAYGSDSFLHKSFEDELLKKEKAFASDSFLHKAHEEELLKKEKAYGAEDIFHKTHEEEIFKKEKTYETDDMIHKALEEELLKKGKTYGTDDMIHKALEEELLKKEKGYGTDEMIHKALEEELLKKEKGFGTDMFHKAHEEELLKKGKAFETDDVHHKIHEDELVKKEIAYGSDGMFHKNKEILVGAEDHHILHGMKDKDLGISHGVAIDKHHVEGSGEIEGAKKSHKTLHDLKAKFFELLRRVLSTRKCHLVTMRPGELLGIVNCISRSKDPLLCEKFAMCEKKMPSRVIAALEKCQKETIPGEVKKCTYQAPLYPSAEIPVKIFQCVAINTRELRPEEKKHMIEFEECARVVKSESCGRFKFLPRPL